MRHAAQASLFADEETELDIASRVCRGVLKERLPHAVTHLRVRRAGVGWVVNGFNPATDHPLLPEVIAATDQSGTWFQLHPKAIGQVDPPEITTASRFTILVRDVEVSDPPEW